MLGLVALWIFVYWWWPASAEPKGISFSAGTRIEQPAVAPAPVKPPPAVVEKPAVAEVKPRPAETTPRDSQPDSNVTGPAIIPPEFIEHTLAPGESLLLISDGIIDQPGKDGTRFGFERSVHAATGDSPAGRVDALLWAFSQHMGSMDQFDDVTIAVIAPHDAGKSGASS